jgi:hypothetical protein
MSKQNYFIEDMKYALYMVDNNTTHFCSSSCHFLLLGHPKLSHVYGKCENNLGKDIFKVFHILIGCCFQGLETKRAISH